MQKIQLLAVALLISGTSAWWRNGHLLTARVAYEQLQKTHPEILNMTSEMLKGLALYTTFEKNYSFVECATFADEIKEQGFDDQSHWHYVDKAFFDDGFNRTDVYPEIYNVTWALDQFVNYLSKGRHPQNDPVISPLFGEGFNLRLLIHYVGDVHQPLHTVSRYTQNYPDGDAGGNLFMLEQFGANITELHALWDSVVTSFDKDIVPVRQLQGLQCDLQPFNENDWAYISENALKIMNEYPEDSFNDLNKPFTEWSDEGYDLAVNFVYKNIIENEVPSDTYISQGIKLAHGQIAKGGYRLANLLVQIFNKRSQNEMMINNEHQQQVFLQ